MEHKIHTNKKDEECRANERARDAYLIVSTLLGGWRGYRGLGRERYRFQHTDTHELRTYKLERLLDDGMLRGERLAYRRMPKRTEYDEGPPPEGVNAEPFLLLDGGGGGGRNQYVGMMMVKTSEKNKVDNEDVLYAIWIKQRSKQLLQNFAYGHSVSVLTAEATKIRIGMNFEFDAQTKSARIWGVSYRIMLHVTLNPWMPQMVAKTFECIFHALKQQIIPEPKADLLEWHANVTWYGNNQESPQPSKYAKEKHDKLIDRVGGKIKAAIYFHSVATLVRVQSGQGDPQRMHAFQQQVLDAQWDLSEWVNNEYYTVLNQLHERHDGRNVVVYDHMVTILRWLYHACCIDPDIPAITDNLDIAHIDRVVFTTDWCFLALLKRMIQMQFHKWREEQQTPDNGVKPATPEKDEKDEIDEMDEEEEEEEDKCSYDRFKPISAKEWEFELQPFDTENPYSVLDNVPRGHPIYIGFMTLCKVYCMETDPKLVARQQPRWVDALTRKHPEIDLNLLARLLCVKLLSRQISSKYLISHASNAITEFEMRYRGYLARLVDFINKNIGAGLSVPPLILEMHYELLQNNARPPAQE